MINILKSIRSLGGLATLVLLFVGCLSLVSSVTFAADEVTDGTDTGGVMDTGDDLDETVESHFSNPAQAAHAANLAEASALNTEEAEALEQELAEAREALEAGEISEDEFAEIEANIDDKFAGLVGVSEDEIGEMRAAGMGWGEIAHELGVHPSVLGLGHQKKDKKGYANQEMVEATERNTKTGYAKGHGLGLDTGEGYGKASGKGLGRSKDTGIAGAAGLGGSKGKSSSGNSKGGNGKGNSGGGKGNNGGGKGNSGGGKGGGKK